MKHLLEALETFEELLEEQPDDPKSVHAFTQFLRYFLRLKTDMNLPSVEIMTLIKHYKPTVHMIMRRQAQNNTVLTMLTNVEMDLEEAKNRLNNLKKKRITH